MEIDLFEQYDQQPPELKKVVDFWQQKEELTYQDCRDFLSDVEAIGYTFDYGLDAMPFELKPIK